MLTSRNQPYYSLGGELRPRILRMPCRSGFDLDRLRAMRAYLLAMGRYGPGVTYTVPRWATINAPPPMGPLFGIWHDVYWSHECAFTAPPCPCYLKRNGRDHPFGLFVYDKSDQDFSHVRASAD